MKNSKIILGIAAGIGLGAVLAVLFAPNDGKTTRKKIANAKDDLSDEIGSQVKKALKNVIDQYNSISKKGTELMDSKKEKLEEISERY